MLYFDGYFRRRTSKFFQVLIFNFLCCEVQKLHFGGFSQENPKLGQINCLASYTLHFESQFCMFSSFWYVQKLLGGFLSPRRPQICSGYSNYLPNILLHCEFQLSLLSSSKVSLGFSCRSASKFFQINYFPNIFIFFAGRRRFFFLGGVWAGGGGGWRTQTLSDLPQKLEFQIFRTDSAPIDIIS